MNNRRIVKILLQNNSKTVYSIYMRIKSSFKSKLGRSFSIPLVEQIILTLFKLRYNLPLRVMETVFNLSYVTIHRAITRICHLISQFPQANPVSTNLIVDSTTIKIGKGKTTHTYSGYLCPLGISIITESSFR